MKLLLLIIGSLIFLVLLSFGVEALRRRPNAPTTLYWAPEIPIQTAEIGGNAIRYIKTGRAPTSSCCIRLELNSIYSKSLCPPFEVVHGLRARLSRARLFGHSKDRL